MRCFLVLITLILLAVPCMAQSQLTFAWDLSLDDGLLGTGGGYKLYTGKQSRIYGEGVLIAAPGISTATVPVTGIGHFFFALTAISSDGSESDFSNEVDRVIKPKPPKLNTVQQVAEAVKKAVVKVAGLFQPHKNLRIIQ